MKNIRKIILICMIWILILIPQHVHGQELGLEAESGTVDELVSDQLNIIDFSKVDDVIDERYLEQYFEVDSFSELIGAVLQGKVDLSIKTVFGSFLKYFWRELRALTMLLGEILALCILAQILKNLDLSFDKSTIGEVGFYVVYMTLVLILIKSFGVVMEITQEAILEIDRIMEPVLPLLIVLVVTGGNVTVGAKAPLVITSLNFLMDVMVRYIIPFIYFVAILEVVNHISNQDVLSHLIESIKKIINKFLKIIFIAFTLLMSLTNIVPAMMDGLINKGAKTAMGSIPVVGSALSGVVDTVLACSSVIKEGVGIGAIIFIVIISLIPVVKLIASWVLYKLTASLVQPVTDKRMVKLLSGVGDYVGLMLGVLLTVLVLFIAAMAVMIQATNTTMMMR